MNKLRSAPKRSCKITEIISLFQSSHLCRRSAHFLNDDRDSPRFSVVVTDSQRNTLAFLIHLYNHKLTRLTMTRNTRRVHIHQKILSASFSAFIILYMVFLLENFTLNYNTPKSTLWQVQISVSAKRLHYKKPLSRYFYQDSDFTVHTCQPFLCKITI